MRSLLRKVHYKLVKYGIDGQKLFYAIKPKKVEWFERDLAELKKQKGEDESFEFGSMYPILHEKNEQAGTMKGHYFHQDLYVAKLIFKANPRKHLDIGSRIDGFVAHVASYREIELMDIREIKSKVENVIFRKADLMTLPVDLINYCDSISSLHAIEHFGLGRYGDKIDYFGHLKAINNVCEILVQGGVFYFSVPIGPQRIEFNAHRVFSMPYLLDLLQEKFHVQSFAFVDDNGDLHEDVELNIEDVNANFHCIFGCGIFELKKK